MKLGVIVYHKDALEHYKPSWIYECLDSISNQTLQEFTVYEMNYGGEQTFFWGAGATDVQVSVELPTYAHAMNMLLDLAFSRSGGCHYVFNVNIDDFYESDRFEQQLEWLKEGYDLVSSDFQFVNAAGEKLSDITASKLDLVQELASDHNPICHPSVAYSRKFWINNRYFPQEVPIEDLRLWQRVAGQCRIGIVPKVLAYCRFHDNNASHNENAR